jgi:hypothetical protein
VNVPYGIGGHRFQKLHKPAVKERTEPSTATAESAAGDGLDIAVCEHGPVPITVARGFLDYLREHCGAVHLLRVTGQ